MYSIRPHIPENMEFNLPTTMYSVKPVIQQTKVIQKTNKIIDIIIYLILAVNE